MLLCFFSSKFVFALYGCRCPAGKRLFQGSTWCEAIDECSETPSLCYYGTCRDLDDGYQCDCEPGYYGPTCRERRGAVTVVVGAQAQLAIAVCAFVLLSESTARLEIIYSLPRGSK